MTTLLFWFAGLFLLLGVLYIFWGMKTPDIAVPISDPEEIKGLKQEVMSDENAPEKVQVDQSTQEGVIPPPFPFNKESIQATSSQDISGGSNDQWEKLKADNATLKSALEKEIQQSASRGNLNEEHDRSVQDENHRLKNSLDNLTSDNLKLQKKVEAQSEEFQAIEAQKNNLEQKCLALAENEKRLESTQEAHGVQWRESLEEGQQALVRVNEEKQGLLEQCAALNDQKLELNQLLEECRSMIIRLKEEVARGLSQSSEGEGDELKKECAEALAARASIEAEMRKLKEYNDFLLKKEKALQYELTKARAQSMGLERITEDLKIKIESIV
jgi:chromosome segregation ATPase